MKMIMILSKNNPSGAGPFLVGRRKVVVCPVVLIPVVLFVVVLFDVVWRVVLRKGFLPVL
jgi:hypothetical protein